MVSLSLLAIGIMATLHGVHGWSSVLGASKYPQTRLSRPSNVRFPSNMQSPQCTWCMFDRGEAADQDLNLLQTRLHAAVQAEDFVTASELKKQIQAAARSTNEDTADWRRLGVPEWLADRVERLGFQLPTTVQRNALKTVVEQGRDAVICSPTGSGKTLAYLLPLLTYLGDDLLEEDLTSYLETVLTKGWEVAARRRRQLEAEQNHYPMAMVVVPTRELGVQVSQLLFKLLGGGGNTALQPYLDQNPDRFQPGNPDNMFNYKGPRHVKVMGLWEDEAVDEALLQKDNLQGVHIVVGTPHHLARVQAAGQLDLQHLQFLVVDEADACAQQQDSMHCLLDRAPPPDPETTQEPEPPMVRRVVFAGASLFEQQVGTARDNAWLDEPVTIGDHIVDSASSESRLAEMQRVPPALGHHYMVVDTERSVRVVSLCLQQVFNRSMSDPSQPIPRVIVYTNSAEAALRIATPLQNSLWGLLGYSDVARRGLWGLAVLLPSAEDTLELINNNSTMVVSESSLRVMEQFRTKQTAVLVTTPAATRGLDFPDVSHVFNLHITGTASDYLHRAGRVGRIGQSVSGVVTSILDQEEVQALQDLGQQLHFDPVEVEVPTTEAVTLESSLEAQVQSLEDLFQLYNKVDDLE